jgi:hypothetical protein
MPAQWGDLRGFNKYNRSMKESKVSSSLNVTIKTGSLESLTDGHDKKVVPAVQQERLL